MKTWFFSRKKTITNEVTLPKIEEPKLERVEIEPIYSTIHELPFILFESCIVHNKLKSLIKVLYKDGEPYIPVIEEHRLREVWHKIYSQFCEEIGESSLLASTKLAAQIAILDSKIFRIQTIVNQLREWYEPNFARELSVDVMGINIDISSYESYQTSLDKVLSRIKPEIIHRDALIKEYNDLLKQTNKKGVKLTASFFTAQLMSVSKNLGYRLDKNKIVVAEYCVAIRQLNEYNAKQKPTKTSK